MNGLYFIEKMIRITNKRREQIVEMITGGSVPDYVAYKSLRSRLEELNRLEEELRDLQKEALSEDE